jgi:predicted ester cyclase
MRGGKRWDESSSQRMGQVIGQHTRRRMGFRRMGKTSCVVMDDLSSVILIVVAEGDE